MMIRRRLSLYWIDWRTRDELRVSLGASHSCFIALQLRIGLSELNLGSPLQNTLVVAQNNWRPVKFSATRVDVNDRQIRTSGLGCAHEASYAVRHIAEKASATAIIPGTRKHRLRPAWIGASSLRFITQPEVRDWRTPYRGQTSSGMSFLHQTDRSANYLFNTAVSGNSSLA